MRLRAAVVLSSAALLPACGPAIRPETGPSSTLEVRLVDSIPWANELGEGVLRRVEVRAGVRVDTVPGVLTAEPPVSTGALLLGFEFDEDRIVSGFEYDVRRRRLRRHRLPADFSDVFSAPSLAPDGRHVAYVAAPGDATGWAVVRSWPRGRLLVRSAAVQVPATDSPGHHTRWLSADSAEIFVETGFATDEAWLRVLASVRERRIVAADTVRRPVWLEEPGAGP